MQSLAFCRDGRTLISCSRDLTVRVWDISDGKEIRTLRGHPKTIREVAIHPDGQLLASASMDGTIRLWDLKSGQTVATLPHGGCVHGVAFSPDGTRLVAGGDSGDNCGTKIWNIPPEPSPKPLKCEPGGTVWSVAWSPDGRRIALGTAGRSVALVNPATGRDERKEASWPYSGGQAAVCANGEAVASGTRPVVPMARCVFGTWQPARTARYGCRSLPCPSATSSPASPLVRTAAVS